jgi:glycerophosphoryl diester phosphodiesterase
MLSKEKTVAKQLVYAHRGASGYAPENTMAAFKKAVELGSHGIECDVQMTKDGRLVVCHDETVDRTTDGKGFIKDMTFEQLRELDAGKWFDERFRGERIPELKELLELVKESGLILNIELKSGIVRYPGMEKRVIEEVSAYGLLSKVIISSFNHYSLKECRDIEPSVKTGALYMEGLYEPWNYLEHLGCKCAHPLYLAMDPEISEGLKARGFVINVFTVNDERVVKGLVEMGVDGIITNYPDKILAALSTTRG